MSDDRFLPVPDASLRFRDEGDGCAIVFVHGWTLDLEMWQPQAAELRHKFRIIRFDRRGFGESAGIPSASTDLQDLQALLDHLKVQRAAIVGMSQGARLALRAVRELDSRFTCLVLDGAPFDETGGAASEPEIPLQQFRELVATAGLDTFRRQWLEHPLMRLRNTQAPMRGLLQQILARYPGHDLENANVEADMPAAALADIRIPTLVLNGEFDVTRRRMGAEIHAALPRAERAIVMGAGHLPNLDRPREYNRILEDFIARHSRPIA